jgi:hypothetical protein
VRRIETGGSHAIESRFVFFAFFAPLPIGFVLQKRSTVISCGGVELTALRFVGFVRQRLSLTFSLGADSED